MRNIDKKYHLLYKTTNLINGKYYYGIHSTNNIDDGYLGSGTYFKRSVIKYGKYNFKREIIEEFDNREELIEAEIKLITKDIILDKYCMNLKPGGDGGLCGMITVKDKNGICFNVFKDDPRYLSKEVVAVATNRVFVKDELGNNLSVFKDDPRYLSGELISGLKNKLFVKDSDDKILQIYKDDFRYLSGELIILTTGVVNVKDSDGNIMRVDVNDPRYLSGELVVIWTSRKHNKKTKDKMSEKAKLRVGNKNSSFGSCWITKDGINKKIKKKLLQTFIDNGWTKGRKIIK